MRKTLNITISIFILSIILVVSGFFLLDFEKTALYIWAFVLLIFSICLSTVVSLSVTYFRSRRDNLFNVLGVYSLMFIYLAAVIVLTCLTALFQENLSTFIFIHIGINVFFAIGLVVVFGFTGHIYKVNDRTLEKIKTGEYDSPRRGDY